MPLLSSEKWINLFSSKSLTSSRWAIGPAMCIFQCQMSQDDSWQERATKVYVYITPKMLRLPAMRAQLQGFLRKGGGRAIVSYDYELPDLVPVKREGTFRIFMYSAESLRLADEAKAAQANASSGTKSGKRTKAKANKLMTPEAALGEAGAECEPVDAASALSAAATLATV